MKPNFISNTLESMKTCILKDLLPHVKGTSRSEGKPRRIVQLNTIQSIAGSTHNRALALLYTCFGPASTVHKPTRKLPASELQHTLQFTLVPGHCTTEKCTFMQHIIPLFHYYTLNLNIV
jgi:hypothetical protein